MTIIKAIILRCLFTGLRLLRMVQGPHSGCIFLAPDVPVTNLGDQALLLGSLQSISDAQIHPVYLLANGPEKLKSVPNIEQLAQHTVIIQDLHVMFATDRAFWEKLRFFCLSRKVASIVLVGADVIDGRYNEIEAGRKLALLRQCHDLGLSIKVVGFSLSKNISEASKKGFKALAGCAEFIARDPVSQQRMQGYAPCSLGADCAFMMKPLIVSDTAASPVDEFLHDNENTLALCLRVEDFAPQSEALANFTKGLVAALNQNNSALLLLPHHPSDIDALAQVADELDKNGFTAYFRISDLPSAQKIKSLVGRCKHVVTSRMHIAIASLGMHTAITCLPYAGKFEGLYEHFDLHNASIDAEQVGDVNYIQSFIAQRLSQSSIISAHIQENIERVKDLSRSNFSGL